MKEPDGLFLASAGSKPHRQRRCRCSLFLCCLLVLIFLAVAALVLALTIFKIRNPSAALVSVRVVGASPHFSFLPPRVDINVTLDLLVRLHNPNYVSFAHGSDGLIRLRYRGGQVGEAAVAPGRIPARGTEMIHLAAAVEVDRILTDLGPLLRDIAAGEVGLDAEAWLPGQVTVPWFVKFHVQAAINCHVAFGVEDLRVRVQECTHSASL
ncbi:uncharacterized protein LOC141837164 [Curcuma longa]|uniref:uncharacterized protein LOC141837164 n=1 Tax=Curcuma longa TaxID=136217 RepID=UPI003D9EAF66